MWARILPRDLMRDCNGFWLPVKQFGFWLSVKAILLADSVVLESFMCKSDMQPENFPDNATRWSGPCPEGKGKFWWLCAGFIYRRSKRLRDKLAIDSRRSISNPVGEW